jgi:hypothetical protein
VKNTAQLRVYVDYDPEVTDAESVARVMDTLIETALSVTDLEEYGGLDVGEFLIDDAAVQLILI